MVPVLDWVARRLQYAPSFAAGVAVLWADRLDVALAWFLASRLAYVGFAASTLIACDRRPLPPREALPAWNRFRARAEWLMWNDAVAISALVLQSRGTLDADPLLAIVAGAALFALGVGVKAWAARTISSAGYYWRDFFLPNEAPPPVATGPYRWLAHPMYTVGYAHVYGVALVFRSTPALLCGVFAQATMLLLEGAVEAPHFRRTYARRAAVGGPRPAGATGAPQSSESASKA
jgi:protein-S-isoprenylcysteine O-methyltransferase Ste14